MPIQYPIVWADTLAVSVGGTSGQVLSIDTITVPSGLSANPVLLLYLNSNGVSALLPSTNPTFTFRFPDSSSIPIGFHFSAGDGLPYEAASSRLAEGGVIVLNATLSATGSVSTLLMAALVDMGDVRESNFSTSGLTPTFGQSGNRITGGVTSIARSFSGFAVGEPFAHLAISRLSVVGFDFIDIQGHTEPHALSAIPTWQVGNIGTWTDIIVATSNELQVGMGLYVASAASLSRSYSITNLTSITTGLGGGCTIDTHSSVFLSSFTGRSYAQVIG